MTLLLFGYSTALQCFCCDNRTFLTTIIDNGGYLKAAVEIKAAFLSELVY